MHRVNRERGLGLTEDDIVGVFLDADANYDGYIDYHEFCSSFSGELHGNWPSDGHRLVVPAMMWPRPCEQFAREQRVVRRHSGSRRCQAALVNSGVGAFRAILVQHRISAARSCLRNHLG
jgi:hypothetical protein